MYIRTSHSVSCKPLEVVEGWRATISNMENKLHSNTSRTCVHVRTTCSIRLYVHLLGNFCISLLPESLERLCDFGGTLWGTKDEGFVLGADGLVLLLTSACNPHTFLASATRVHSNRLRFDPFLFFPDDGLSPLSGQPCFECRA